MKNNNDFDGNIENGSSGELIIDHGNKSKGKSASKSASGSTKSLQVSPSPPKEKTRSPVEEIPALIYEKPGVAKKDPPQDSPSQPIASEARNPSFEDGDDQRLQTPPNRPVNRQVYSDDEPPLKDIFDPSPNNIVADDQALVPGGFMSGVPNPQAFFKSRYRSHPQSSVSTSQANGPIAQPVAQKAQILAGASPQSFAPIPPRRGLFKSRLPFRINFISLVAATSVAGLLIIVLVVAGNRPERVYGNGMTRTGKALDKLHEEIFAAEGGARLVNSALSGSITTKYPGEETVSTFEGSLSEGLVTINGEGSVVQAGQQKAINYSLRTSNGSTPLTPEIFINIGPTATQSAEFVAPGISTRPNTWIASDEATTKAVIDRFSGTLSGLFPQGVLGAERVEPNYQTFRSDAVYGGTKAIIESLRKFVFTAKDEGILEYREFVGQENDEDLALNHYSTAVNKVAYKDFCVDMKQRLGSEQLMIASLVGVTPASLDDASSCDSAADAITDDTVIDIWIDTEQKVLQKMRVYYSPDLTSYREFGQVTKVDKSVEFYFTDKDTANGLDARATLWYEFNTSKLGVGYTQSLQEADSFKEISLKLDFMPGENASLDNSKPIETVPLNQFLNAQGKTPADLLRHKR